MADVTAYDTTDKNVCQRRLKGECDPSGIWPYRFSGCLCPLETYGDTDPDLCPKVSYEGIRDNSGHEEEMS
mgnify:CR=1 FL=1